jgi:hypothetical protein
VNSQIQRSIGAIRDKFTAQNGRSPGLEIDYLIYCPDHRVVKVNGAGIDMSRTVDAAAKDSLAQRIEQLLGPGSDDNTARREVIEEFFRHTFGLAPDVSTHVTSQDRVYTQLIEGLGDVIEKLELTPFRLRVAGSAGAGKSQLTLRFVDRALRRGMKPLLLCYNRPLADRLGKLAPAGARVNTYDGFCTDAARTAGIDVNFSRDGNDTGVWQRLREQLVAADIPESAKFDCLVVDEGQDFEQEWFDILELFLKPDAAILWLEDPLQNLRRTRPVNLPGFATYREPANFRSPQSIGRFIKRALEVDFEQRNPLPGLGVLVHTYDDPQNQPKIVAHRINELLKLGFDHEEIAIVSCIGMRQSLFSRCERLGPLPVRRFTGKYDVTGRQIYTEGRINFDTIYRFKGQQAPAVILVDVDPSLIRDERSKAVLYCGMTRATVRLELVVHSGNTWLPQLQRCA